MKYVKIMAAGDLEELMTRLAGCQALLYVLQENAGISCIAWGALGGVSDLLETIRRDFQADIDCAEDYMEGEDAE